MTNLDPLPEPEQDPSDLNDIRVPGFDLQDPEPRGGGLSATLHRLWGAALAQARAAAGSLLGRIILAIVAGIVAIALAWHTGDHGVKQVPLPPENAPMADTFRAPVSRPHGVARTSAHRM